MPYNRKSRRQSDPGLQPERTALSWQRTLFLLVGVSMLFFRLGYVKDDIILTAGSIVLLLSNLGLGAYVYKRNLFDLNNTILTSEGSILVKKMICFAIIFSSLLFALSITFKNFSYIFIYFG